MQLYIQPNCTNNKMSCPNEQLILLLGNFQQRDTSRPYISFPCSLVK